MNLKILHANVQKFISDNLKSDITKLILKGSPFKDISIQELANQIVAKQKSEHKLISWFRTAQIYYPSRINIEQTSSEPTANYKSNLVTGTSIIDITGGFGIDCFYFSKQFKAVTHCEINTELSTIVAHNFKQLNVNNITTFSGDAFDFLRSTKEKFDCIYIDPSRRDAVKRKVFLLQDCVPNVPENIDFLFSKTNQILIKTSPILDITSAINELKFIKEVHVVAIHNEVKELLFLLDKKHSKAIEIKTVNIGKNQIKTFDFKYKEDAYSTYSEPLAYLYEPNSAILKSGGFHQITNQFNVQKLHQHSHLYTSGILLDFPGRTFKVEQVLSYDKKKLKKLLPENKANITTRNFPKTVAQIRKETKIKEGGNLFIFFTTNFKNELIVLICKKQI
ncbi:MAG: 16S rRNA G966 N2-methylase RsmD [Polaribacter sp.]